MADWLTKGFDKAEEQAEQFSGSFTREFFIKKANDEAVIRILDDEPINIRDHFIKGENKWYTCSIEDCPLCEAGNKATNHFIFHVIDRREFTDVNGNLHQNEVKLWRCGIRLLRVLKNKAARFGPLSSYDIYIKKLGAGQNVSYDIDVVPETVNTEPVIPEGQERYNLEEVLAPKAKRVLSSTARSMSGNPKDDDDDDDESQGEGLPWNS